MIINLHISHTNLANESRLLRETRSIVKKDIADRVIIVGKSEGTLAVNQILDAHREISRISLRSDFLGKSLIFQLIKFAEFTLTIILRYRNKEIMIVNCHSLAVLPIGVLCKFLLKTKLIYDTHELETETFGLNGIRKYLSKIVEKHLVRFVDLIIVVGNAIADEYTRMYDVKRPTVVLNCPNYVKLTPSNYLRSKFKLGKDTRVFLYQGVLSEGRGLSILLETFSKLKNPENNVIVFLGYGPFGEQIRDYAASYSNIFFHQAVPSDELIQYTASADIGIAVIDGDCLSYRYCLPNKLFEYLMAGLPVIVSNLPEMKKIVQNNKVGFVLPHNNAGSLQRLIETISGKQIEIIKNNSLNVAKLYNWEAQESIMIDAYQKLM